MPVNLMI